MQAHAFSFINAVGAGVRVLCFATVFLAGIFNVQADELMRSVQAKLSALGYYKGIVDGAGGSMTSAAIRRFQLAEHLKVTGELNRQTLAQLGFDADAPAPDYTSVGDFFKNGPLFRSGIEKQVEAVRLTQKTLAMENYYAGPHNGLPGAVLISALKDWQRANGLVPTGRLDSRTVAALGLQKMEKTTQP